MLSLALIGIRLEQQCGFGLGGSVLSSLFLQHNISVGASGALFGLLGAVLAELLTNWSIYSDKVAALVTFLIILSINFVVGILLHMWIILLMLRISPRLCFVASTPTWLDRMMKSAWCSWSSKYKRFDDCEGG